MTNANTVSPAVTAPVVTPVLDKTYIQALVQGNDKAAIRALLAIYDRQTESEKAAQVTKESNGIGFSGCDSEILSSFAEWYKAKGYLSPKQLAIAKRKISRYWKQLLQISEENGHTVSYKVTKKVKNAGVPA
jgi:hypothetical protein